MFDVFISHSTDEDGKIANEICAFLESGNVLKCWIAPRQVTGGKSYAEEITDGVIDCPVFLLLLSKYSVQSKHILNELDTAFNEDKVIIPFFLEDVEIPKAFKYYLRATQHIIGYPSYTDKLDELKTTIVDQIPELASERQKKQISEYFANEWGWSIDRFKQLETAILKKKIKNNLSRKSSSKETTSTPDSDSGRSRYDILQNSVGDVLIILSQREGDVGEQGALFIIDPISKYAMLYRSHESTVIFDDIAQEANKAILRVGRVSIVECSEDDVVREYKATVKVVQDVRLLMDNDFVQNDETDLYEFINIIDEDNKKPKDSANNDTNYIIITYETPSKEKASSDSLLIYQQSGDNLLFLTKSCFVVPQILTKKQIEILNNNGIAYVFNKNDNVPFNDDEDNSFPILDNWLSNNDSSKKEDPITVNTLKVDSILQYLADKTKGEL